MKFGILLVLLFAAFSASSQVIAFNDTASHESKRFHRMEGNWMYRTENSFGLVPTLTVGRHTFLGLSIAKGSFTAGEYGGIGKAIMVGTEYSPEQNIVNYHATGFLHAFTVVGGINLQLSAINYRKGTEGAFSIRPQIGLGLLKGYINYGYNLFTYQEISNLARHNITFSFYITTLPWK
jgi:hypothetical protein